MSIPAWAGETAIVSAIQRTAGVYPRVGGGNAAHKLALTRGEGLSPRGRGKLISVGTGRRWRRSIPAWAGETRKSWGNQSLCRVYPRVGGGNQIAVKYRRPTPGLSPRGRGKLLAIRIHSVGYRSIPAWAGETPNKTFAHGVHTVYPRVGGGN